MLSITEYRCRLCGELFRIGDPVPCVVDSAKHSLGNVVIDVPASEIVITKSVYPRKEIRIPLIRYHVCKDQNNIGIADFAGFIRWE